MRHDQLLAAATAAWTVACSLAGGSLACGLEGTSRSVARGGASVAQAMPQRQQAVALLAIGA